MPGARVLTLLVMSLVLAGCNGSDQTSSTSSGELVELTSVETLKPAFAEDEGRPRLLLLLSPT